MWERWVWSLRWEGPLEEGMTTHSSILVWRIPQTEEPGGLWSKAWQRVRHNWSNLACTHSGLGQVSLKLSTRRRQWHPTPVLLPGESIPWTEEPGRLQSVGSLRVRHDWMNSFSLFLSCIREGDGNPLQCSCLGNPGDGGAWWAAISGVARSRTRLKRLGSGSSSKLSTRNTGNLTG